MNNSIQLQNVVWKEGKFYVAQCLNFDVSSFGKTKKEALDNLNEALELYFEDQKHGQPTLTVIVPANRREIPVGTFRSILRQSRLQENDFKNLT